MTEVFEVMEFDIEDLRQEMREINNDNNGEV